MPLTEGSVLGNRYRLLSQLGRGGMGRVWLARDELLHRDIAAKEVIFPYELTPSERDVLFERTMREARSAARLSHPGIVTVHDVVEDDGRPWIVMEYVRASSLQDVIDRDGGLPTSRVAEIGVQMLAALRTAHAAGILHRDIKPANVLLETAPDGSSTTRVVITDFGIARIEGESSLTQTGKIMGSAAYIAPERAQGEQAGPASDLWAVGATLYAACEGRAPYKRATVMATLAAIIQDDVPQPKRAGALTPLLMGLLAREPAARMTADQATDGLARVAGISRAHGKKRRKRKILSVVAAFLLTAATGVAVSVHRWGVADATGTLSATAPGAVPPGFVKASGPSGSTGAVPSGWTAEPLSDLSAKWTEDATGAYVQIDAIPWGVGGPADHWLAIEPSLGRLLQGYRRIRLVDRGSLRGRPTADLEYTWLKNGRGTMRACDRGFTANGHQYAILVAAPDGQWTKYADFVNTIFVAFQPAP